MTRLRASEPDTPQSTSDDARLGEDLLIGATAIARELNWRAKDGTWNKRRVYYLAETGKLPIHHVPGLGICARRTTLREFFERLDKPYLTKAAD